MIDKSRFSDNKCQRKVLREVNTMRKVHHPNVLKLLEVFDTSKFYMIVLEYANRGDLLKLVKQKIRVEERQAKPIFLQIVHAIIGCHSNQVIHRDIKLDNILLTQDLTVKLCDFGVSRTFKPSEIISEHCGTPAYLAPEIIVDRGYEGPYVDIWSLGVLLYALLCGTVPFKATSLNELHKLILTCNYQFPRFLSAKAKDLIQGMLQPIPFQRISLENITTHPWLKSCKLACPTSEAAVKKASVINQITKYGYRKDYVKESVRMNELNHITATYYLLCNHNFKT